ncbi:hypothetical protein Chor_001727 [Crotalus horridus]
MDRASLEMQDRLQELLKAAILVDSMEVDCLPGDHMGAQHLEAHMDHRHPVEDHMDTLPLALRVECMGVAQSQEGHMDSLLIPMVLPNLGPMGQVVMEVSGHVPPGVDPEAFSWFQTVDADHSSYITTKELKQALVNSNWSAFSDDTCLMMMNMFDKSKSGRIDLYGFSALWRYIQQWRNLFQQFDRDHSGNINCNELHQALCQMGYNLSPQFAQLLVSRYAQKGCAPSIQLDRFIQICTLLQSMTEAFREKDTGMTGNARISYEDFLMMSITRML